MAMAACVAGCNSSGCINNQNSLPLAGFYSYADLSSVSIPGLTVGGVGAPNDSLIVDSSAVQQVYLPFRSQQPSTSFYFHYNQPGLNNDLFNDTLTFVYTSMPYFASEECGAMFRYVITDFSYTRHLIDSVGLVDSVITNIDRERIHIYFRTATTDPDDEDEGDDDTVSDTGGNEDSANEDDGNNSPTEE